MRACLSGRDLEDMFVMKINFNTHFLREWVLNLKKIVRRKLKKKKKLETCINKLGTLN